MVMEIPSINHFNKLKYYKSEWVFNLRHFENEKCKRDYEVITKGNSEKLTILAPKEFL